MQFDEVIEFKEELYQKNLADHEFPEGNSLDGKGEDDD